MVDRSRRADGRLQKLGPRVLSAIGRQEWLDRPSYRLEHLISFAYNALGSAGRRREPRSRGRGPHRERR